MKHCIRHHIMEEKCFDAVSSLTFNIAHNSSSDILEPQGILLHQPSTSRNSMSHLQGDFENSQHNFAEVLDDETTTSGVLETFDISSSNSLPTCSDATAAVVVEDSSSTDTVKLVEVSGPISRNNEFFNAPEVYVINDDDDDDEEEGNVANINSSQGNAVASHLDSQMNSVIVSTGGGTIYLETPVVEEQQHHPQLINFEGQLDFAEKSGKPKRLSDDFLLTEEAEALDEKALSNNLCGTSALISKHAVYNFKAAGPLDTGNKSEPGAKGNIESSHDGMSFRLKKMNINNSAVYDIRQNSIAINEMPSSSHGMMAPTIADIESMDLIERRDFETEQRLTGELILKSNALSNKKMLNISLIKSCLKPHYLRQQQKGINDDCPGSSNSSGRVFSSDSKCTYNDSSSTPTSSRNCNSRLTKSTAKLNLCSTLSQTQNTQQLQRTMIGTTSVKLKMQKSSASSSLSSSSVIVEAPTTSANAFNAIGASGGEIYSSSNSNDSLAGGNATITRNCHQEQSNQHQHQQQRQHISSVVDHENSCSRTSAIHTISTVENNSALYDDPQPSTSSARCQYAPPPKGLRQVHASAQTNERYLSLGGSNSTSATALGVSTATVNIAVSGNGSGVNLTTAGRTCRRLEPTSQLIRSNSSEEVMSFFKGVSSEAATVTERDEYNEDTWVDCDENNSDLEEICTCHHSTSGSSHGGSNTSLNDTEDVDVSGTCGKDGDLSNYIQMVSISEEASIIIPDYATTSLSNLQQRKRKYNEMRLFDDYSTVNNCSGGIVCDANSRKRIAYDYASSPRSSQSNGTLIVASTPSSHLTLSTTGTPLGRRTPRSIIPTRDNPPPELQNWLAQFQRWSHVERLLAVDRLIEHCEPTQVRHMMKVIEPQFQRDFISLLPRELALQVLAYLDPKDLLLAAQTCRSWRFLCDDNLLWKEKCRKAQILTEPRTDRPKRGRAGNMPPIASPWKAAYMRQNIIEMNWRSRPIREPKVLKGHDDHVITCLQFSGNRIVSGSDDNTLKVWSAVTGRCLRTLVGHTGGVWSSQMSGNIIISGSTDRTLKVWDMETGDCVHTLLGHTSTVRCMHLNGNKVVSGSRDATLRVWDIEQGTCLHVLVGHLAAVRCVQYDGKLIVSGAYDYMVKIWHPERQECLHTLQGHTNRVYSLQFDGMHVVSGSLDTSIRVWDVETGNCKHTLMGHQSLTSGMELRQNILVSGNADSTVKVWDITTGQCLQTLSGPNKHQSAVTCLQFNARFVVTSSDDGTVKLWDVKTGDFIRNLVALESGGSGGVVWRIRANDTKLICAVGSRNGTEETKLMVLDFDVEGACVKCS